LNRKPSYHELLLVLLGIIYILFNLIYLTRFPFVHSDESWLGGLSRNILELGDYSTTESFFDLYPRNPHALKIFFHTLQIIFIKLMGYEVFSLRLISLLFGLLSIYWFYKLTRLIFCSPLLAIASSILLAVDIQYIYASHFARQEIILLFIFIFALHYFLKSISDIRLRHHLTLGTIIGLSIGLHPNSFLIFLSFVFLYLFYIFNKSVKLSGLLIFILIVGFFASSFIVLSLHFDPSFFCNYSSYGGQFGVLDSLGTKFMELRYFYQKLYYSVSGTYYTPDLRLQFMVFAIVFCLTLFKLYRAEDKKLSTKIIAIILSIIAINAGIMLIGRFNQTSIIFVFPLFYILVIYVLENIQKKLRFLSIALLSLSLIISSYLNIRPYIKYSYNEYLQQISTIVPKDSIVLANLNCEFYFDNNNLFDYRNLAYLRENSLDFKQYIEKNNIDFIIYPEEMELIFEQRPRWNGLYGNVYPYYHDMKDFLQHNCELVSEFSHPTYGVRISEYINSKEWRIKIYKVIRD